MIEFPYFSQPVCIRTTTFVEYNLLHVLSMLFKNCKCMLVETSGKILRLYALI